jgi:hypothetical protein
MDTLVYQVLCKRWKAKYSDFQELVSCLEAVLAECVAWKNDFDSNPRISITFTKQQYFCNAFYVFKTFYMANLPFTMTVDPVVVNDFYTFYLDI